MSKKKIFIIVPKYVIGGAELVMSKIAITLSKLNLEIFFVILTGSKKIKLNKNIKLIYLKSSKVITSFFKLKKIIDLHKPNICLSTISHTNILLFIILIFSKFKFKLLVRESNNIFESLKKKNFLYRLIFLNILKYVYKKAILITPSKKLSHSLKKKFNIKKKVFTINNPIEFQKIKKKKKIFDFINIGSLTDQKDHLTILKALKLAVKKNNKLQLLIIGTGVKLNIIKDFILNNNLKKNVTIYEYKKNIYKYLRISKIFILSSKFEGYPNVLLEAASANLPIISTNCNFGPKEILENARYGKLFKIGDYLALSKLMLSNYKLIKKIPLINLKNKSLKKITYKYYDLFFKKNI